MCPAPGSVRRSAPRCRRERRVRVHTELSWRSRDRRRGGGARRSLVRPARLAGRVRRRRIRCCRIRRRGSRRVARTCARFVIDLVGAARAAGVAGGQFAGVEVVLCGGVADGARGRARQREENGQDHDREKTEQAEARMGSPLLEAGREPGEGGHAPKISAPPLRTPRRAPNSPTTRARSHPYE